MERVRKYPAGSAGRAPLRPTPTAVSREASSVLSTTVIIHKVRSDSSEGQDRGLAVQCFLGSVPEAPPLRGVVHLAK